MADTTSDNPFGSYGQGLDTGRSWFSSLIASSGIYLLLGLLIASGMATKTIIERKKPVPVKFVEKVVRPPAPAPAPPKPVEAKPIEPKALPTKQAAPAAAVPKDMKVRKLDKPPPPKELVAPKDMPLDAAPEVDASLDQGVAVYGDGPGDVAGLEGGVGGIPGGIVSNPDKRAVASVRPDPPYPSTALGDGREGSVLLRCIVLANGKTHSCDLVDGETEFATAAIDTVQARWTWTPGELKGKPVNTVQSVVVNFKIQVG
jgi:outer membrane biosynthesis protein TonB